MMQRMQGVATSFRGQARLAFRSIGNSCALPVHRFMAPAGLRSNVRLVPNTLKSRAGLQTYAFKSIVRLCLCQCTKADPSALHRLSGLILRIR